MSLNLVEKHLWMMICKQRGWMLGQDSTIQGLESRLAGSAIQCCSRVGSQSEFKFEVKSSRCKYPRPRWLGRRRGSAQELEAVKSFKLDKELETITFIS